MKKAITKIVTTLILIALTFSFAGCPYTANGSVIQDVSFTIDYTDSEGAQTIDATLSLYKTFAPKTTKALIKHFKQDVYENNAPVLMPFLVFQPLLVNSPSIVANASSLILLYSLFS